MLLAGRGLTEAVKEELINSGIDVLTMGGNHVWDNKEIFFLY